MSDTKYEVYKAIVAITGALAKEGISKANKNQQQGFAYRSIDQVYAALSTLLAEHKLCILPRVTSREATERTSAKGGVLFYTAVTVDFDLVSAIDGSRHTVTAVGEAFDSGDKSIGKAQSYAYKAMAFMLFAVPVEGQDNDPDANSHEVKPAPPKPPAAPPSPVMSAEQTKYFPRCKVALDTLYGQDVPAKTAKIEELTTWEKDGMPQAGVKDYRKKDGKSLEILCHQLEKLAAAKGAE